MSSPIAEHLRALIAAQPDDPVEPRIEAALRPDGLVDVTVAGVTRTVTPDRVLDFTEGRKRTIANRNEDPYRYGWEPEVWRETDWRIAELRCQFPGEPIIVAALGGNGSSKTWYAAKRTAMAMVENHDWLVWQFALEEKTSRETPQRYTYRSLPTEYRTETGKLKKGASTKLAYNEANGFTDNTFSLGNKCRLNFIFYNSNIKALEGPRPDFAWADEEIPKQWIETVMGRLITKAGFSRALVPRLREALAARAAGDPAAYERLLRPLVPSLLQGVLLITFTPRSGYTPAVGLLVNDAVTVHEVPAEILPRMKEGQPDGFEMVPRLKWNHKEKAAILYFHVYDNVFGGNWEAMKSQLSTKSREEKLWKAYGVAVKTAGVQFPLFSRAAHVRSLDRLPKEGTWYHIADPCDRGRPWFMLWAKVDVHGNKFIAREWPQPGDWIDANDIGDPGMWAIQSEGKKHDGDRGPAQGSWGLGFRQMAEEIERVERELFREERRLAGDPDWREAKGRIAIAQECGCRIMDGRVANTETQTHGESETIIQIMERYGLSFVSAGRDSGAEQGTTTVREGVAMIVDALNYDTKLAEIQPDGTLRFDGRAPTLIVASQCENTVWCMQNWTGRDGGEGASKDPVDTVRYLVIAGPMHYTADMLAPGGGGHY